MFIVVIDRLNVTVHCRQDKCLFIIDRLNVYVRNRQAK